MENSSGNMKQLFDTSIEIFNKVLKGETVQKEVLGIAKQTVSVYGRLLSAENSQKKLYYDILKDLSKDKEDLQKRIMANIPELKDGK